MKVKAVYDSGSNVSLINKRIVNILKSSSTKYNNAFRTMNGLNFCSARANIILKIGNITNTLNTYVVKNNNFSYDLLLGLDAISKFKLNQDDNLNILQKTSTDKLINLTDMKRNVSNKDNNLNKLFETEDEANIKVNFYDQINKSPFKVNLNHIKDERKKLQILKLLQLFRHVFAKDKFDIGKVKSKVAEIKLIRDEYVTSRAYKCTIPDEKEIKAQVKELLKADLIEESDSAYASPVTLAYKKEDGRRTRLCIDFRKLNKLIIPECYPFPTINDIVDKVSNCKYFSVFDINSAFWSISLAEKDRDKTSFITKFGKFMFKVLPFGLKNAPAIFQRILSNIIRRNNLDEFCINYIDDISIFSKTWNEHINHITRFLQVIETEGIKLKLIKCIFASCSVKYLGHFIQENKISPAQENLVAIKNLKRPTDKTGVRSVLGSINFYLKYIENSAKKLEPLHRLLRKNTEFIWTNECEESFNIIKDYLCSSPILAIYDVAKEIYIETDASLKGIGATLKQPQEDGMLHPVAYFSRKLSQREKKWTLFT